MKPTEDQYNRAKAASFDELSDILIEAENQIAIVLILRMEKHDDRVKGLDMLYGHLKEILAAFNSNHENKPEPKGTMH